MKGLGFPRLNRGASDTSTRPQVPQLQFEVLSAAVFVAEGLVIYPTANRHSLVVWDMERQQPLGQLEGHDDEIEVVAARGSLAVSCQYDGPTKARLWNLETMQCTAALPLGENVVTGYTGWTWSACCMESKVLMGQHDGIVKLWDVAAGTPVALAHLEGHTAGVRDVKAAAAGSMVLSGSFDNTVRLWDLRTSTRCVRTMEGHSDKVMTVDMDGHCRTAVSGSIDETVKLWDLGSGRCTETYKGHDSWVENVMIHESGSGFLSSGYSYEGKNGVFNVWAVDSTRAIAQADLASCAGMPSNGSWYCMFASRDLSTITLFSISLDPSQLGFSVWR